MFIHGWKILSAYDTFLSVFCLDIISMFLNANKKNKGGARERLSLCCYKQETVTAY